MTIVARPAPGPKSVAAVVLAGGRSSRMGAPKAFVELGGRPLVAHVLERLERQVARVYLNAPEDCDPWRALDRPLAIDAPRWRGAGPLAGILAALGRARADGFAWLASAPCDAPFLALDLVERLTAAIDASGAIAAVAATPRGVEPMFAIWPVDAAERVEAALAAGWSGPRSVLLEMGAAFARFESGDEPAAFANVNTREDLAAARAAAKAGSPPTPGAPEGTRNAIGAPFCNSATAKTK